MLSLLSVLLFTVFLTSSTVYGEASKPTEITIDGVTIPLRECRGPVFSGHDAGLIALAASGLAFMIFWLISMCICIGLVIKKGFGKAVWICLAVSIVLLLIGAPLIGTGAYYGRYEKTYDVMVGCDNLPLITASSPLPAAALETPINFTIAYVGDSSVSIDTVGVWRAILAQNPDALVQLGDYDYCDDPTLWGKQLKFFFGTNFPIIPAIGNHDLHLWGDYSDEWDSFEFWQNQPDFIRCEGIKYVQYWCIIRGVFIAFSSVGTKCGDGYKDHTWHVDEQRKMLEVSQQPQFMDPYITCAWHKNYNQFQLASDRDEAGFEIYDVCAAFGALTVNGHDHVYGRTQAISSAENPYVEQVCNEGETDCVYDLTGTTNATIISITGLGGWELPDLDEDSMKHDWWATTYNQAFGALICKYNVNGSGRVYCYFTDIYGNIADEFTFTQKRGVST